MINTFLKKSSEKFCEQLFKKHFNSVTIKVRKQVSNSTTNTYVRSTILSQNVRVEIKKYVDIN